MKTYGHTVCPSCTAYNNLYRPEHLLQVMKTFDDVTCWNCGHAYSHSEQLKPLTKTEKDGVYESGRY